MRPFIEGEILSQVSISIQDQVNGSPKVGDMIAQNPKNHNDKWLVAKEYFEDNLREATKDEQISIFIEQHPPCGVHELADAVKARFYL